MAGVIEYRSLFVSYSHDDTRWLHEVMATLAPLVRQNPVHVWEDSRIRPSDEWDRAIGKAIDDADAALLLVTPAFFESAYIVGEELPRILRRHAAGTLSVFWIALEGSRFRETPLQRIQCLNDPELPLAALDGEGRRSAILGACSEVKMALIAKEEGASPADDRGLGDRRATLASAKERVQRVRIEEYLETERIHKRILDAIDADEPIEHVVLSVLRLFAERQEVVFRARVKELHVIERLEDAGLYPPQIDLPTGRDVRAALEAELEKARGMAGVAGEIDELSGRMQLDRLLEMM